MGQRAHWIATWTASPEAADPDPQEALLKLDDQTIRERIRITLGGPQVRIQLSNEYGNSPILVGDVSLGIAQSKTTIVSGSLRRVTFGGKATIVIPAGAPALSDPIDLSVKNGLELAISVYVPKHVTSLTWHSLAMKQSVISGHGDHTKDLVIENEQNSNSVALLSQVLVPEQSSRGVIVAFGDSIVDGDKSTPEADHNWPSNLFRRLQRIGGGSSFTVVNEGVAGNRLLSNGPVTSLGVSGLARFGRDALGVPGVTDIILLEGTNDIGFPGAMLGDFPLAPAADSPTVEEIIGGYQQLINQSHTRGIRIIGCTIMPTEGASLVNYYSEAKERTRQAVNSWIRTSRAFDGVIDFDAVMRDPLHPRRLIPKLASDDHIHPNDAGYQRMADAIDLSLFK